MAWSDAHLTLYTLDKTWGYFQSVIAVGVPRCYAHFTSLSMSDEGKGRVEQQPQNQSRRLFLCKQCEQIGVGVANKNYIYFVSCLYL